MWARGGSPAAMAIKTLTGEKRRQTGRQARCLVPRSVPGPSIGRVHSNKLTRSSSTACKYFHRSTKRHISEVSSRSGQAGCHGPQASPLLGMGQFYCRGQVSATAGRGHSAFWLPTSSREGGFSWPHFCQMLFLMDFSSVLSRKCVLCWKPRFLLLFCCYFLLFMGWGFL